MLQVETKNQISLQVLEDILEEMRLLRQDIAMFLPYDDLNNYENPERIKASYKKAIEQ